MLLIGSMALREASLYVGRESPDIDIIGTAAELRSVQRHGFTPVDGNAFRLPTGEIVDFEVARPGTSAELYLRASRRQRRRAYKDIPNIGRVQVASPEILYSLKRSHRHRPKAWQKHIVDYLTLRTYVGDVDRYQDITAQREREYPPLKTPSLDKSVAEFFDDDVSNRYFIHDQIHEVMAHGERPLYEKIRVSPDSVKCSVAKWNALTEEERINCVLEEAYVIALERAVIPFIFGGGPVADPFKALDWALMRICTTLCSGWFREFATDNYSVICYAKNDFYTDQFLEAVETGCIRPAVAQGLARRSRGRLLPRT